MQDDGIVLYRRFLDGDEKGLAELISLYHHGLLRFICGYVHDFALAEDLLQEVFVQIYMRRTFKAIDGVSFKTYLYKIARNKCLNELKHRKRKKELSLDALTEKNAPLTEKVPDGILYATENADDTLENKQRTALIHTALSRLKDEYREVLLLKYFDDLPPERIAKITGKKIKQVYNLLARGKVALKEELLKGGTDYEDF